MADPSITVDSLQDELGRVRYYGVGVPLGRLEEEDLPGLVGIAIAVGGKAYWPLAELVEYAVLCAVARLRPLQRRASAAALFGFDPSEPLRAPHHPGQPVPIRRKAAAALLGYKPTYFRRYLERGLLREMAKQLLRASAEFF